MNPELVPEDELLDRAWLAVDEGEYGEALQLLARLPEDLRETWVLRAAARLELDEIEGAAEALERAEALGDEADPDVTWLRGELDLRMWRLEEARARFTALLELETSPAALGRYSLCCELLGDLEAADKALAQACELDPDNWPLPPRLDEKEFEDVIDESIAGLPEPFRDALEETQLILAPVPTAELVNPEDPSTTPPDMLGLFIGRSNLERSIEDTLDLPPSIYLFKRNLERAAIDREELLEEIRVTLYHEVGHMLGFDEEGVDDLGLA